MEGKTFVQIHEVGRNSGGKVVTVGALFNEDSTNDLSIITLPVEEFKSLAEGKLALDNFLKNEPNPKQSTTTQDSNDTNHNTTHPINMDHMDEETDRLLSKPTFMVLINAPQCSKIAIEALVGNMVEDLDTSATLSNKSSVNWVLFSIKGMHITAKLQI